MRHVVLLFALSVALVGCSGPKPAAGGDSGDPQAASIDDGGELTPADELESQEGGVSGIESGETPSAFVGEYSLDKDAWLEAMGEILKQEGISEEGLPDMLQMMRDGQEFKDMRMELTLNSDGTFEGVGNFDSREERIKGAVEPTSTGVRLILTERNGGEPSASDEPISFTRLPDGTLVQTDLPIQQPALVMRKK